MGGLVHIPGEDRKHRVRPLVTKECTLVQGLPCDYYDTMRELGMSNKTISKAAAMGWPIRTGCSVIEQVMEVNEEIVSFNAGLIKETEAWLTSAPLDPARASPQSNAQLTKMNQDLVERFVQAQAGGQLDRNEDVREIAPTIKLAP